MMVKESGGVLSASIEETNRVRAKLGLKPLADSKSSSREVKELADSKQLAEEKQRARDEEAMRAKLEDARRQRLLHAKLGGKSIGEQLEGEACKTGALRPPHDPRHTAAAPAHPPRSPQPPAPGAEMDSAAAWVAKSRRQEDDRMVAKAERRSRPKGKAKPAGSSSLGDRYDEMDEASQVAGALVAHRSEDFKEGEEVILTLADAPIMGSKDGDYTLLEGDEMLENVSLAEDQRRAHAREMAKGVKQRDDPFATSGVLGKYDDEPGMASIRLDASGAVDEARAKKLAAVKQRLAMQAATGGSVSTHDLSATGAVAAVPRMRVGADYMSAAELATTAAEGFKKPANKEKKKMRKKVRDAGDEFDGPGLDLDAMAAAEAKASATSSVGGDVGTRAARERRVEERAVEAQAGRDQKAQRFERALEIAEGRAAELLREPPAGGDVEMAECGEGANGGAAGANGGADGGNGGAAGGAGGVEPMEEEEEEVEESAEVDAELYAALARARRVGKMSSERREDGAAARLSERMEAAERWAADRLKAEVT